MQTLIAEIGMTSTLVCALITLCTLPLEAFSQSDSCQGEYGRSLTEWRGQFEKWKASYADWESGRTCTPCQTSGRDSSPASTNRLNATYLASLLGLQSHPEGGFFTETYKSTERVFSTEKGNRTAGTHIYYLLVPGEYSSWHRLGSDEVWHAYLGGPTLIYELDNNATDSVRITRLGTDFMAGERPAYAVQRGTWFGATLVNGTDFALVGTTVSPGFEFSDFTQATSVAELQTLFPRASEDLLNLLLVRTAT